MKRHPALQDLSRDHHFVLRFCQRIRRAVAARAQEAQVGELVDEFLAFYRSDMLAHFQEEDGFVVPIALNMGSKDLIAVAKTVEADHAWLRTAMAELARRRNAGGPVVALLADIEPRLSEHVRMEEARLFEGLQDEVQDDILRHMWAASYRFRSANRSPEACETRPPVKIRRS
jgi:hypothetical protein